MTIAGIILATYCSNCGTELKEDAGYCYKCGSPARPSYTSFTGSAGGSGLDLLSAQKEVQDLWLRRVAAFIIDVVIVGLASGLLAIVLAFPYLYSSLPSNNPFFGFWGFWVGSIVFLIVAGYFVLTEAFWGRTIGKEAMGLRVVRTDGKRMDLGAALLRNISKVHWLLLLLDVVVGLAMHGDGRQKFSDRLAGTTVESSRSSAQILR